MSESAAFKDIPFDDDADEVKTWKGLALSAIMDLRRYAHDAGPERRMVSAEAYEADAERIHAHAPCTMTPAAFRWKWADGDFWKYSEDEEMTKLLAIASGPVISEPLYAAPVSPSTAMIASPLSGSGAAMIDAMSSGQVLNWQDDGNCNAGRTTPPSPDAVREKDRADLAEKHLNQIYDYLGCCRSGSAVICTIKEREAALSSAPVAGEWQDISHEARFLLDRLDELDDANDNEYVREFEGHVRPPMSRLRRLLPRNDRGGSES